MRTLAANLNFSTDTFNTAFTDINLLLWSVANEVMTANSVGASTTGNAALVGTFTSSNVAVTGVLRGGNLSTANTLSVTSNVIFSGVVNVSSNVNISGITNSVGNSSFYGNSTVNLLLLTGNSTVSEATLNGTNLRLNSNVIANGSASFNNTFSVVGNTTLYGNSTVLALAVTTNSTATNVHVDGTTLRVNSLATFTKNVSMTGDLTVSGSLNASLGPPTTDYVPSTNATLSLGNSTFTWLGHFDSPVIYTRITASANGVLLGNTTNRFAASLTTANTSGNVAVGADAVNIDAANKRMSVNAASGGTAALNVSGTINTTSLAVTATANVTGNVTTSGLVIGNTVVFSNTTSVSTTSLTVIDSFPKATYPSVKYMVFVKDTTTLVHSLELLAIHEGTNVLLTKYAEIYNTSLGTFDVSVNGANVQLEYTSSGAGTGPWTVKVSKIQNI